MSITSCAALYYASYYKKVRHLQDEADHCQRRLLERLLRKAEDTEWGYRHGYSDIRSYEGFVKAVPVNTYEELKKDIDRMRHGESDILWKGRVKWYAKSSGTTSDKSKYIPVSRQYLHDTHYGGGMDAVAHYLHAFPKSRLFDGKALILGGSHEQNYNVPQSLVGDLSAILIENVNPLVNWVRVPSRDVALLSDFEKKRDLIARLTIQKNVTNLSGVPSWMLSVLNRVLEVSGKNYISDVWPHLEVFFHGGIAFAPYREQYEKICDMSKMHFLDTYNASEGFFAVQSSWETTAMLLLLDIGVFYEFIPIEDTDSPTPEVYPVWEVEAGKTYELVITACNGLWRYRIGDTVTIEQTNPVKIKIAGRTKNFINAFGEELMVHNADAAITKAAVLTGAQVLNYTAAPVYAGDHTRGRHEWLVEFAKMPASKDEFMKILDECLRDQNSDYDAKRSGDIFLDAPTLVVASEGLFDRWLGSTGKLGGQRKIPRLSNDRDIIEQMLKMQ